MGLMVKKLTEEEKQARDNASTCIIGLWLDYEDAELVTLKELKDKLAHEHELNEYRKEHGQLLKPYKWTLNDICDGRKNTNVRRFKFCPDCGKEIDWKSFREEK